MVIRMKINELIQYFISLPLLKIIYIYAIDLLLPDNWELWSFNKDIVWSNIYIEFVPFLIGLVIFIAIQQYKNSNSFFATIFFLMYFIPNNSTLCVSNYDIKYYLMVNIFAILVLFALLIIGNNDDGQIVHVDFNKLWENRRAVNIIRVIVVVIAIAQIVRAYLYNGLNFALLFTDYDMYAVRSDYANFATGIEGSLVSYVLVIVTYVGNWFLLIGVYFSLMAKKYWDTILCVFAYLAIFLIEMQKSTLFILLIVVYVVFLEKKRKTSVISLWTIRVFLLMFLVVFIEYYAYGESWVFTTVIRRMFYMPTYLTNIYYEFFKTGESFVFRQDCFLLKNILSPIFGRPYSKSAVDLISDNAFSGLIPSPNTGMFAEAYAQLGLLGIVVFPFIYATIAKIMRKAAGYYGEGAALIFSYKLCSSMSSTFVLLSGNMVGIIMFVCITTYIVKPRLIAEKRDSRILINSRRM